MNTAAAIRRLIAPKIYRTLGIDIFAKYQWLNDVGSWPLMKRDDWRLAKLNGLLDHCWKHVPFYRRYWRDHGISQEPLRNLEELARYPVVTHDLFRAYRDQFVADNLRSIPHKLDSTGGTTGAPLKYFHDLELHALRYACQIIGWGFAGYQFGDPVFIVSGGSLQGKSRSFRGLARGWLENKRGYPTVQMDADQAIECFNQISRFKPKLLVGYPSTLSLMLTLLRQGGRQVEGVGAVVTTAEMLLPHYRKAIEDSLQLSVFDHYGCNDGGVLSYECERHCGFHYNDFESILETQAPDVEGAGELAITNLWNHSMPFIRYLNGDIAALATESCACGRGFPLIKSIRGRSSDILRFSNGKNLAAGVGLIFKDMPIDAWQVVQVGPLEIEARIKTSSLSPDDERTILQAFRHQLGGEIKVRVNVVPLLTTTKGGKLKPVYSEWKG